MQHERHTKVLISDESKILIKVVDYKKSQGRECGNDFSSFVNKKVCTHCEKNGHITYTCYKKHDFPPYFGKNNIAANNSPLEEKDDVDDSKYYKGSDSYTFTKDQYNQIMNLLHSLSSL